MTWFRKDDAQADLVENAKASRKRRKAKKRARRRRRK